MLEVRYNKNTKEITGWWGSRFGNHKAKLRTRPDNAIVKLNAEVPEKSDCGAYLYDESTNNLKLNPAYVEPEPARDLVQEIDDLKDEIKALKDK